MGLKDNDACRLLRAAVCVITVLAVALLQPVQANDTAVDPETDPQAVALREINTLIRVIAESRLTLDERRDMVQALLDRNQPMATEAVAGLLETTQDTVVKQAVLQALNRRNHNTDPAFIPILFRLLHRAEPAMLDDLALTLGRIEDNAVTNSLAELARDPEADIQARQGSLLALAVQRTRPNAAILMSVLESDPPQAVQEAAFTAMVRLTGIREHGRDLEQWRRWWATWQNPRTATDGRWYASLIEHHVRRNAELAGSNARLQDQLLESQRRLFWALPSASEERQALLIQHLDDPSERAQAQGVSLAGQLITARNTLSPELKQALLRALNPGRPLEIREAAARLFAELVDPDAARFAVQALRSGQPEPVQMRLAYALILERLPQAEGVEPLMELLAVPNVRDRAATALLAAINADIVDQSQRAEITRQVRLLFAENMIEPTPRLIQLLARLADDADWARIQGWLTHGEARVRQAAAAAIAANPDQPLAPLVARIADEELQSSIFSAAAARGRTAPTLRALLANRPRQDERLEPWQNAVLSVAGRLAPDEVVAAMVETGLAPGRLSIPPTNGNQLWRWNLALELLGQVTAALRPNGRPPAELDDPSFATWVRAVLMRAEVRLRINQPEQAMQEWQVLEPVLGRMDTASLRRWNSARLVAFLWSGQDGLVLEQARAVVAGLNADDLNPVLLNVIDWFDQSIRFHVARGRIEVAGGQLNTLKTFIGSDHLALFEDRLRALDGLVKPEAEAPADTPISDPGQNGNTSGATGSNQAPAEDGSRLTTTSPAGTTDAP